MTIRIIHTTSINKENKSFVKKHVYVEQIGFSDLFSPEYIEIFLRENLKKYLEMTYWDNSRKKRLFR